MQSVFSVASRVSTLAGRAEADGDGALKTCWAEPRARFRFYGY